MVKHHGIHFLEKKQEKIKVFDNNKNDVKSIVMCGDGGFMLNLPDLWTAVEVKSNVIIKDYMRTMVKGIEGRVTLHEVEQIHLTNEIELGYLKINPNLDTSIGAIFT